jgi:hypothetical protein
VNSHAMTDTDRPQRRSARGKSGFRRPQWRTALLGVAVFVLGSLSFGAWAASSSIGSTPDSHYHLPSIVCGSFAGNVCEVDEATGKLIVPEALIEGLSCTTQRPNESAGCQPLMNGSDTRTREHSDVNILRGMYPFGFYETLNLVYQDNLELAFVTARWLNGILFIGLTMLLWWASPQRLRSTIQWMWPLVVVPLGMFFIASANPTSWAIIGVGTGWMALLGFLESAGRKKWLLAAIYLLAVLMASSARIDATLFVLATSLISFWLADISINDMLKKSWLFGIAIAFVAFRLLSRPGNFGVVNEGFGPRDTREYEELTWSSLNQAPTFEAVAAAPTFDWNLLWRNFIEVPGIWFGVVGGYPWGSLGWLDTSMPQIIPIMALASIMAVATVALKGADWRRIVSVLGMFGVLWFIPLYLLQIGGFKVGEEFQPRYLIPMVVVMVGMLVMRSKGSPPLFAERFPLIAIAVGLSLANSIALHTNIRRYVTGMDVGGLDLDFAREWWWWFMPQFFTPNLLWIGGSLAFAGVTWIVIYHLPRKESLAFVANQPVTADTTR